MGYQSAVVIYDRDGRLLESYELEDFYPESEISEILSTVSSRWWRCPTASPWINNEEFWLMDVKGGGFRFDLNDGSYEYEAGGVCADR